MFTFAATVASAERGGKHNGSSAAQFLSGPACAVPEQDSSNHMAFVRGRTRSGLIGGSYGEIFFASGAGTRAAANRNDGASAAAGGSTTTAPAVGGDTSGSAAGTGSTGGSGSGAAVGGAASSSSDSNPIVTDPAMLSSTGASGDTAASASNGNGIGNGNGNGDGNGNANGHSGGNGNGNGNGPIKKIPAAVNPEPSTWLLLGTALCGFFVVRARQAQSRT